MYGKRRTTGRRGRRPGGFSSRIEKKLPLQLACCLLILSAAGRAELLPEGPIQDVVCRLKEYAQTDYGTQQAVETFGQGLSAVLSAEGSPQMVWPCNEIESMALSADSESKCYSFSSDRGELQVYASCGGTVEEILDGRIVISHGNGLQTVYAGCTSIYVEPLQKVRKGQLIASVAAGSKPQQEPQLRFQILKQQQAVDIGDYLHAET